MAEAFEGLTAKELDAVAVLWARQRRRLATSFSGTSMLPTIAPGQSVTVDCGTAPGDWDVAVLRRDGELTVHRVVARGSDWLLTWGDANPLPDEPFAPAAVIGVVRDVPAGPRSLRRRLLLKLLTRWRPAPIELTRRVRRAYAIRAVWSEGLLAFAAKVVQVACRYILSSGRARA